METERNKAISEAIELCKKKAVLWRSRYGYSKYTLDQVTTAYRLAIRLGAEISHLRYTESPNIVNEEAVIGCEFHCEDGGWLPTDGELDTAEFGGGTFGEVTIMWPTEYTACPCNPAWAGVGEEVTV